MDENYNAGDTQPLQLKATDPILNGSALLAGRLEQELAARSGLASPSGLVLESKSALASGSTASELQLRLQSASATATWLVKAWELVIVESGLPTEPLVKAPALGQGSLALMLASVQASLSRSEWLSGLPAADSAWALRSEFQQATVSEAKQSARELQAQLEVVLVMEPESPLRQALVRAANLVYLMRLDMASAEWLQLMSETETAASPSGLALAKEREPRLAVELKKVLAAEWASESDARKAARSAWRVALVLANYEAWVTAKELAKVLQVAMWETAMASVPAKESPKAPAPVSVWGQVWNWVRRNLQGRTRTAD